MPQRSIKSAVSCGGIGLHSGKEASLEFRPAGQGNGIVFVYNGERIPALVANISGTKRGTSLGPVSTVEHVLSAVYGLGIDNVDIFLSSAEPPALDGSAKGFTDLLLTSGLVDLSEPNGLIVVRSTIELSSGDSYLKALPSDRLLIEATIDYSPYHIGRMAAFYDESAGDYAKSIAPARTFGLMSEAEELKKAGLALGASIENAVGVTETGYSSPLRFENELARHKILDIIGDIALTGKRVCARIVSYKAGHKLNTELARRLINA